MENEIVKTNNEMAVTLRSTEGFVAVAQNYLKSHGEVVLPPNYDVNDAVKSLYLTALQVEDKQGRKALEVCTKTSIEQVVQTYVSKGLNVAKKQCYLVVYGSTLTLQEGYFGKQKQAKDYAHIRINSNVIYKDEEISIEQRLDGTRIIHHKPDFTKFDTSKIVGAYAVAVREDGTVDDSDIMTAQEIKISHSKSKTGGTVHKEFPVEMHRKTVITRLAKRYINTSDDSNKFDVIETDMGDYYADEETNKEFEKEINAEIIVEDNVEIKEPPKKKKETTEMVVEDLGENNTKEISYAEFKNNPDKYTAVAGSYNSTKKTIKVYC